MKRLWIVFILLSSTALWARHDFWEFDPKMAPAQSQVQPAAPANAWDWKNLKTNVVNKVNTLFGWNKTAAPVPAPSTGQTVVTIPSAAQQAGAPMPATVPSPAAISKTINKTQLKAAAEDIRQIQVARVAKPAVRSQDKRMSLDKVSKIPVFDFKKWALLKHTKGKKVSSVPALDIGTEAELDESSFAIISIEPLPTVPDEKMEMLPSPELISDKSIKALTSEKYSKATPAEKIILPVLKANEKISREKIDKTVYSIADIFEVNELPVIAFTDEQLKLIKGLIIFEKTDQCHVASGHFRDLVDSKDKRISEKSRYHLGYCLVEMNLPLEATHHLGIVVRSQNADYTSLSLKRIVEDVPVYLETQVAEAILTPEESMMPPEARDKANYIKAKYFLRKGQPRRAVELADKVSKQSDKYFKAQYVASVGEYELKNMDASITRQKALAEDLKKRNTDKEVAALVQLNLARMNFQKGKYKESLFHFQQVPKEHPLWLQGLTEQAWAQLQAKDAAGAIGNMHSIHSPYFKNVYKPESYIVRGIGYLNICQYGDSYKSLGYLEHQYGGWLKQMEPFEKKSDSKQTYDVVLKYLQGKSTQDVDGVPFQVIREIARQRDFLNAQDAVNHLIDEGAAYPFLKTLIAKDKRALAVRRTESIRKIADLNIKIKNAAKVPGAAKNLNTWKYDLGNLKDFLSVYDFKLETMSEGEKGLTRLATKSTVRIDQMKATMKSTAGKVLKTHLARLIKDLKQNFENNELLKYEIYAGSGENLRFKIAGGKTGGPTKMAGAREPAGEKWDFDGEYWEDEIGNYRSGLKNNCQTAGK